MYLGAGPVLWYSWATLVQAPGALAPTQLPANACRKATEDCPDPWASATNVGDLYGVPASYIQPIAAIWGENQQIEDRSLFLSLLSK